MLVSSSDSYITTRLSSDIGVKGKFQSVVEDTGMLTPKITLFFVLDCIVTELLKRRSRLLQKKIKAGR